MDDLLVCRICLIVDVQMYNLRSSPLDKYFEHLFGVNPHQHELLTQVCAECAALINKCFKFREKCINGINILQNMLKENTKITKNDLLLLDRDQCKLSSVITLGIPQNHHVYVYSTCPQDPEETQLIKQETLNDSYGENNNSEDKTMKDYDPQSENNHLFFCGPYVEAWPQIIEPAVEDVHNIYGRNHFDSDDDSSIETMESEEETKYQLNKRAMRNCGNKTRAMNIRRGKSAPSAEAKSSVRPDKSSPLTAADQQGLYIVRINTPDKKEESKLLARKSQKKISRKSQKKIAKLLEMEKNRKRNPLTGADRQRRYRERLKTHCPEKYEEKRLKRLARIKQNKKNKDLSLLSEYERVITRARWRRADRRRQLEQLYKETREQVKLESQNRAPPRVRWFPCGLCPTAFATGEELRKHEISHRDQSSYKCDCCGETFSRLRALSEHKMIHTGEKPHGCHLCTSSFRRTGDLRRHKRNVHGLAAE